MFRRSRLLLLSPALAAACSRGPSTPSRAVAPIPRAVSANGGITPDELRRDLFAFAADSFQGRETGTAEANRAAAFLARRVQQLGLEPAGDSLYVQRVPLIRERPGRGTRLIVTTNGQSRALRLGADVTPFLSLGDDIPSPRRSAEGDLVFIGYGATSEEEAAELASVNLDGKVAVVLHGAPPGVKGDAKERLEGSTALGKRSGYAWRAGAVGVIALATGDATEKVTHLLPELLRGVSPADQQEAITDAARTLPLVLVGVARRGSQLLPSRWPNDVKPQELGRRFTGCVELLREPFTGYNVVAVLRGRDFRMNKTYVAYGAHYDHIGVLRDPGVADGDPAADSIANGADDDG